MEEYLKRQGRFRHLFEPERDDETIAHIQATVNDYWKAALRKIPLPLSSLAMRGRMKDWASNNEETMMQNIFDICRRSGTDKDRPPLRSKIRTQSRRRHR